MMLSGLGILAVFSVEARAAGSKPVSDAIGVDSAPALQTPRPYRAARLAPVSTTAFQLPNGTSVDLSSDLDAMLSTAVTTQTRFLPLEDSEGDPDCASRIELRATVSAIELNVGSVGLTFGYTPGGEIGVPVTNLTGTFDVRIGTIAMDFGLWQCSGSRCVAMAASTATHATAGVNLGLQVNFSEATTGVSFLYNSGLSQVIRSIMNDGMKRLAANPRLSKLSWYAIVREVAKDGGQILFDAGTQAGLVPGDAFEIYARTPSVGACDVYKTLAVAHAERVDTRSTTALIDAVYDGTRDIQPGDVVLVREVP